MFDGFKLLNDETKNLIKKEVIAGQIKQQTKMQADELDSNTARVNFYKNRKMLLFIHPEPDMWEACILFNSKTKKYELYDYNDGAIWRNIKNMTEFEDIDGVVRYLKEHVVLRIVDTPLNIRDFTTYEDYEESPLVFHCESYGKKMLDAFEKEFNYSFTKKNIDRSTNYPHFKPGKVFIFSI